VFVVEAFNLRRGDTLTGSMSNSRFVSVELGKGQRERTALRKGASPAWHEEFDFSVWDLDEQVFVQVRQGRALYPVWCTTTLTPLPRMHICQHSWK
jgi:hypothetical protein